MKVISILAISLGLTLAQTSHAEVTTYAWTGSIAGVYADDGTGVYNGIQIGDIFSGTFTYDSDVNNIEGLDTSDGNPFIETGLSGHALLIIMLKRS